MCENQKPAFVVALHWDDEHEPVAFFLPYGGDLWDLDAVFDYLANDPNILGIADLDIPEGTEVQVSVNTYCENCGMDVGFHIMESWVLNAESEGAEKFLAEDLLEEMAEMPVPSILFITYFIEELEEWLDTFEEELEEYIEQPNYVPYVEGSEFSGLN